MAEEKEQKIKVRQADSADKEEGNFVKKSLPSQKKAEAEKKKVQEENRKEREENIKTSLSEIYKDDKGGEVDVKKISQKKKSGIVFWFFNFLFLVLVVIGISAGVFYYLLENGGKQVDLEFSVEAKKEVLAGEEFFYEIQYKNPANFSFREVRITADYPDNFILLDSFPEVSGEEAERDYWEISEIPPNGEGRVKIKGKIIDKEKESAVFLSEVSYTPSNFSSQFSREASFSTNLLGSGFESNWDYPASILVGEEEKITLNLDPGEENYLKNFILEVKGAENIEIKEGKVSASEEEEEAILKSEPLGDDSWNLSFLKNQAADWELTFSAREKLSEEQKLDFIFKKKEGDKEYIFKQKTLEMEVIKSNLDLSLIINGSEQNNQVNFGETLNYSLNYANKGETAMKDLTIMAALESQSLDWTSLKDPQEGVEKGNTITWTPEQIPKLENLEVGEEGTIDFSIEVIPFPANDLDKSFEIRSYAQFILGEGGEEQATTSPDNRSNAIVSKINSDLSLTEEIRYFNKDNIPVGTGPLPPQVGEETTFKVYWELRNNLHELKDVKVTYELPEKVSWNSKNRTSAGSIRYNPESREIIWDVGRLPLTIYQANAEFSISLNPEEGDKNKILVLSPGSTVEAYDTKTEATVTDTTKAKTTKLEDDDIADESSDGRVE
mgnify:CR=1 FL=1